MPRNDRQRRNPVLIFDWDDTILPSSFVDKWNIEHFDELPLHVSWLISIDIVAF
jgi:hypothetical protein